MQTLGQWSYHYRENEDGENDGSIIAIHTPGHAYCVAKAPRYADKKTWIANASVMVESKVMLHCIRQLLTDLPTNRDWLDPHIEQDMRDIVERIDKANSNG